MRNLATSLFAAAAILLLVAKTNHAATVTVELATARGTQITAPQEWLQLLTRAGATTVRVRGIRQGDQPLAESLGGEAYRLQCILTARGELLVPGDRFTRRDTAKIRDYLDRLTADGPEALTAPTGAFGLTKEQFEAVFEDLSKQVIVATKGQTLEAFVATASERLATRITPEPGVKANLRAAGEMTEDFSSLTFGTALGVALRGQALALVPHKPRGGAVELRIMPLDPDTKAWPIGYEVKVPPRTVAPDLMQSIKVEIDGFNLAEATSAIIPRLTTPVIWDHWSLAKRNVVLEEVQVKLPPARLSYKRILEKLLFQARLRGSLRVDEAGTPFFWISGER